MNSNSTRQRTSSRPRSGLRTPSSSNQGATKRDPIGKSAELEEASLSPIPMRLVQIRHSTDESELEGFVFEPRQSLSPPQDKYLQLQNDFARKITEHEILKECDSYEFEIEKDICSGIKELYDFVNVCLLPSFFEFVTSCMRLSSTGPGKVKRLDVQALGEKERRMLIHKLNKSVEFAVIGANKYESLCRHVQDQKDDKEERVGRLQKGHDEQFEEKKLDLFRQYLKTPTTV